MMEMMKNYSDRLGMTDDIKKLKVVHVAGTKGKGSHLIRLSVNFASTWFKNRLIYVSTFNRCYRAFQNKRCSCKREVLYEALLCMGYIFARHLTTLKIFRRFQASSRFLTLVGFKIFATLKTDVVVLEVGMGGRLDATNVCNPVVCGITPLDLDHTRVLGDTIDKIAYEKRIMKIENVPCFTGVNHDPRSNESDSGQSSGNKLPVVYCQFTRFGYYARGISWIERRSPRKCLTT